MRTRCSCPTQHRFVSTKQSCPWQKILRARQKALILLQKSLCLSCTSSTFELLHLKEGQFTTCRLELGDVGAQIGLTSSLSLPCLFANTRRSFLRTRFQSERRSVMAEKRSVSFEKFGFLRLVSGNCHEDPSQAPASCVMRYRNAHLSRSSFRTDEQQRK